MSKDVEWETPQNLFQNLDKEFNFDIDVCATKNTTKCKRFFSPSENALEQDWVGTCFMNPPSGRYDIYTWLKKAYEESLKGATVVCLIPSKTDTKYWHDFCMKASEIRFIKGRLKFSNLKRTSPFPSAIVVFDNHKTNITSYGRQ